MKVIFKIIRQQQNSTPRVESYTLDVAVGNTILDCLNRIKWEQDGSLTFRKNCRNTICGSCTMKVNGRSILACQHNIGTEIARLPTPNNPDQLPEILISPMGNFPVIKDLVVDMSNFWNDLEAVEPYVSTKARQIPEREFLQTPQERSQLDQVGNCVLCGACYSECNAKEVNPQFVGPHALAKAQRMITDSRDTHTQERLEIYNNVPTGVWGCTRCYMCNEVCPMEVAPMDQISKIKQQILQRQDENGSRAIRHRKTLINLVKEGGWVDERKFGIILMSNKFKDIKGLSSLLPLGLRMLSAGKFPFNFEPSEGTKEVKAIIEAIQNENRDNHC